MIIDAGRPEPRLDLSGGVGGQEVLAAVSVRSLSKSYGGRLAVEGASFDVGHGVTALLGPNGAGKTTIIRCIAGLQSWNHGTIEINGIDALADPRAARKMVGYMPERAAFPPEMRVRAYLEFVARMKGVPRANRSDAVGTALTRLDLGGVAERIIANLSKGFRQRVGLAQAVLGDPPVLMLDEPLAGVDPLHVWELRDVLWDYGRDHAVMLSTHVLPEARVLCDRVIVIAGRTVAFDGSLVEAELSTSVTRRWRLGVAGGSLIDVTRSVEAVEAIVVHVSASGASVNLVIDAPQPGAIDSLVRQWLDRRWRIAHLEPMTDLIDVAFRRAGITPGEPGEHHVDFGGAS